MNLNKSPRLMPILMAVCVVIGILIGTFYTSHFSGNKLNIINSGSNRLNNLLHIIDDQYVDSVNLDDLVEKAMPLILAELDPHSVYISADEVQMATDDLKGSFSGVGIEFVIRKDTVRIQNVIKNGPADRAGLLAGDKIVMVDGKPFVGEEVTNAEAMHRLKGKKGTKVEIGVERGKQKGVKKFTVTRDDIVTHSVSATYMIDPTTGYIRIKNFGENTYGEVLSALAELSQHGFENLMIDLRDNSGGLMASAIQIADEFLPKGRLIVYTEGRKQPRQSYTSTGRGSYQRVPLVVLINEGSASAAEIFAGAIQDNDRGTIIGRRSFGKGLVQNQLDFTDGSLLRLTIARYYTPSGRCIQKPYTDGNDKDYVEDLMTRYTHGELFSEDSIKHNGPKFHTRIGRTVYGGGGITPDIFVPEDTTGITSYYREAFLTGLIRQFAFAYSDENRAKLTSLRTAERMEQYLKRENLLEKFAQFAEKRQLRRRNLMLQKSRRLFERNIYGNIIYNVGEMKDYLQFLGKDDPVVIKAQEILDKGLSFPVKVEETKKEGSKEAHLYSSESLPLHQNTVRVYRCYL